MSAALTVHFVRHGEVHNPEGILYARLPGFRLSTTGEQQARSAGNYLAEKDLAAIYVSPMERAQQTAGFIADAHPAALTPQTDARLNESYTPYEGQPLSELEKTQFDIYRGAEPPYEQPGDIRRRVRDFVASMRDKHPGETITAVTHGDVLVVMFLFAQGAPPHELARGKMIERGLTDPYPATAGIVTLHYHSTDPDEVPEWAYHRPY